MRYVLQNLILWYMMQYHSSIAHSAYLDLLRNLQDEEVSQIRGSPLLIRKGGRRYWYDNYRIGNQTIKRYIGEDSEATRHRIADAKRLKLESETRQSRRTRLVRLLRAEGFGRFDAAMGSLISAMANAGVFRLGGTLVGTAAFKLYEGELGIRLSAEDSAQTDDIDIASFERLSIALAEIESGAVDQMFADFRFEPVPTIAPRKFWRWKQARGELKVEFLTPSFAEDEGLRLLPALGVYAQSLHHINFLIAEPVKAAALYRSGVLVQIPRPERFAIHKLIVADRRQGGTTSLKSVKDRRQAGLLIATLGRDRPDELREALETAKKSGPKWRERIDQSLRLMPESAEILKGL